MKYQEESQKDVLSEEKKEVMEEEEEDITELPMMIAGVEAVGYDITGDGEPDYCGFVNQETGEVDQLVPIEEIREMDVEIVLLKKEEENLPQQTKKEEENLPQQKVEVELEPLEHRNPSLHFKSRSSLEIPSLMRFSLLDMTPKHSKINALRTHVSEEVVAEFNHVEPPPPSPYVCPVRLKTQRTKQCTHTHTQNKQTTPRARFRNYHSSGKR